MRRENKGVEGATGLGGGRIASDEEEEEEEDELGRGD